VKEYRNQNDDEDIKGADSRDEAKHNERSDQLFLEDNELMTVAWQK